MSPYILMTTRSASSEIWDPAELFDKVGDQFQVFLLMRDVSVPASPLNQSLMILSC
jgi:hypothetical protein